MGDALVTLVIYAIAGAGIAHLARDVHGPERALVALSFAAHALAAPAQVWITEGAFGGGDMFVYHTYGMMLADWARFDPWRGIPELLLGVLRLRTDLPFELYGGTGSPTGAMQCISALLMLATGDSLFGGCAIIASANAIGQVVTYLTVRRAFPTWAHLRIAVALLLTPSVVFWTSGLLKEAVAMLGFAPLTLGAYLLVYDRRRVMGIALIVLGAIPFALLKPYVLAAFFLAGPVLVYARRVVLTDGELRFRAVPVTFAGMVAFAGVALFGWFFPEYSVGELADEAARLQEAGMHVEGGSNVSIVDRGTRSLASQIAFLPIALLTSLFRPFVFEARGGAMFIAALETAFLSGLLILAFTSNGRLHMRRMLKGSPMALTAVAFTCVLGAAVGLASTNLGTLSRYRVPMMPFWALFLALATAKEPTVTTKSP